FQRLRRRRFLGCAWSQAGLGGGSLRYRGARLRDADLSGPTGQRIGGCSSQPTPCRLARRRIIDWDSSEWAARAPLLCPAEMVLFELLEHAGSKGSNRF